MGIMGKKNKVVNIEIKDKEFFRLKTIVRRHFNIKNVEKIFYVVKGKSVYEIVIDDAKSYRLDIYVLKGPKNVKFHQSRAYYQTIGYKNGIHTPKVIGLYETPDFLYKLSEWIKGRRIGYVWNSEDVFTKAGIEIAKINCIKDPNSKYFLGYNDFTKANAIWTEDEELYLVDVVIAPKKNVDGSVIKILIKNLNGDRERIEWFLGGYKRVRNIDMIRKMLEEKERP